MLFAFLSGFLADFLSVAVVDDGDLSFSFGDFSFTALSLVVDFLVVLEVFSDCPLSTLDELAFFFWSCLASFLPSALASLLVFLEEMGASIAPVLL